MWDVMKNCANILNQMLYKVYVVIFSNSIETYIISCIKKNKSESLLLFKKKSIWNLHRKKNYLKKSYKSEYKVEGIYLSIKICSISYSVLKHHHL